MRQKLQKRSSDNGKPCGDPEKGTESELRGQQWPGNHQPGITLHFSRIGKIKVNTVRIP